MIHRHLQIREDTEPEQLPWAAIVDLLDRGDLDEWWPLVRAVTADPWGPLATVIARLVDHYPMYGVSPLWRNYLERMRAAAPPPDSPVSLVELRRRHHLTQKDLAGRLGISQSDLSKLERRGDVRVSTLRRYVAALGGRLRLVASESGRQVDLLIGDPVGSQGRQSDGSPTTSP